jgi:hypothetical protein
MMPLKPYKTPRDKFKRASKKASNVGFLGKEAKRAYERSLQYHREAEFEKMEREGRLTGR